MEQDINKLIEELTNVRPDELSAEGLKLFNKINEIIDINKELKEENAMLKKVNKITKNITTEEIENAIKEANKKYIPVSLVEEKIEDFRDKTVWGYNDWKYDENVYKAELNIIDKLEEELLEKRK